MEISRFFDSFYLHFYFLIGPQWKQPHHLDRLGYSGLSSHINQSIMSLTKGLINMQIPGENNKKFKIKPFKIV